MTISANETYAKFMDELRSKLEIVKKFYLIHDNASIHGGLQTDNENNFVINLPPYSLFLNPIESVFFKLKIIQEKTSENGNNDRDNIQRNI